MQTYKEHRNQEILQNLRATLTRRGLSQRDLARLLQKKESEISRWFSGRVSISKTTQTKIENILQEAISSDSTFGNLLKTQKIGIIGTGSIARRFASEISHVQNVIITAAYNTDSIQLNEFCKEFDIEHACSNTQELMEMCDSIYIASPVNTHYEYARLSLERGRHTLCEMPFTCSKEEAKSLYQIAQEKNLILMPALKTASCPSFIQMIEIAKSGIIGDITEISAAVTTLLPDDTPTEFYNERLLENATYPLLATYKLFGTNSRKNRIFTKREQDKIRFAHICMEYTEAISTFRIGVGVKSEGSLVISGTKGYIYVPAPWWKTEYFEVRFENQNDNKKYFFPYESSGLRYEIQAFADSICRKSVLKEYVTKEENMKILELQNKIENNGK